MNGYCLCSSSCVTDLYLCSSICTFCQAGVEIDFYDRRRCECLLVLGQVYIAETKTFLVEPNMTRILQTGKAIGQMHSLLEATIPKVTKASAMFVQSMCVCSRVAFVCACICNVRTCVYDIQAKDLYLTVYTTNKMPDGSPCPNCMSVFV